MYGCESWTIKKAVQSKNWLWCWRRLLWDTWTARRSNQSILKEINLEYSLEELMLKLQYFGHLMQKANTLEKTRMLGKTEGRRRRGQQKTRWLDGITNSRACSNSCPSSQWCDPTISSSVIPFSSCLQSFPASGSFPVSQLFISAGQTIGVSASASVLPMNIQDWFPLGLTGWISLQSNGLSRVFSNTTVQKHQFFSVQPSL